MTDQNKASQGLILSSIDLSIENALKFYSICLFLDKIDFVFRILLTKF